MKEQEQLPVPEFLRPGNILPPPIHPSVLREAINRSADSCPTHAEFSDAGRVWEPVPKQPDVPGYESLRTVLEAAYHQAARGKGAQRHAQAMPFHEQPMQKLIELYGQGFALGQAGKKMQEAQRLKPDAAERELIGAIVYIAGAIIHARMSNQTPEI